MGNTLCQYLSCTKERKPSVLPSANMPQDKYFDGEHEDVMSPQMALFFANY